MNIPKWQIAILAAAFFIGVWSIMLFILTYFSKTHTWLLPVFAVGLGAPRWCQVNLIFAAFMINPHTDSASTQMLWGTSMLGYYVPWAGSAGPYLSISLWLWLGVLDAIQGVGLGLILLHVCVPQNLTLPRKLTSAPDFISVARLCNVSIHSGDWFCGGHHCPCHFP